MTKRTNEEEEEEKEEHTERSRRRRMYYCTSYWKCAKKKPSTTNAEVGRQYNLYCNAIEQSSAEFARARRRLPRSTAAPSRRSRAAAARQPRDGGTWRAAAAASKLMAGEATRRQLKTGYATASPGANGSKRFLTETARVFRTTTYIQRKRRSMTSGNG